MMAAVSSMAITARHVQKHEQTGIADKKQAKTECEPGGQYRASRFRKLDQQIAGKQHDDR